MTHRWIFGVSQWKRHLQNGVLVLFLVTLQTVCGAQSAAARAQSEKLLIQAKSAAKAGDFEKLVALCTQAAQNDPKYWRLYSYRGFGHQKLAGQTKDKKIELIRLQRAQNDYQRYLALAPKSDVDRAPLLDALKIVERRIAELQKSPVEPTPTPQPTSKPPFDPAAIPPDGEPPAPANYEIPKLASSQPVTAHQNGVTALAIAPGGASLATGSWIDTGGPNEEKVSRGVINLWRAADAQPPTLQGQIRSDWAAEYNGKGPKPQWLGHYGRVTALAFSPGNAWLASGGFGGSVMLWNANNRGYLRVLQETAPANSGRSIVALAWTWSENSRTLLALDATGRLSRWTRGEKGEFADLAPLFLGAPGLGGAWVRAVAFSRDGRLIAAGDANGAVAVWDTNNGSRLKTFDLSADQEIGKRGIEVTALAFSPDNRFLAAAHYSHIYVGALEKFLPGETVRYDPRLFRAQGRVGVLMFSPDGNRLIARAESRLLMLDPHSRFLSEKLFELELPNNSAPEIALSPRVPVFFDAGSDGTLRTLVPANLADY